MQEARHSGNLVIVPGAVVETVLAELGKECRQVVEDVYIEAARGGLVNPDSLFLRPDPDRRERAIALPAYVPGAAPAMGVKWISSFPGNLALGLPRASALIALNDVRTGLATAVLEGSRISGHRTALSAAVGARALRGGDSRIGKLAVIGTGYISATTLAVMAGEGWTAGSLAVHDLDADRARAFAAERTHGLASSVSVAGTLREALDDADVVLFATTAVVPYVTDAGWFKPGAVVLHMSLRDLEPEAMADAAHVVDDVSHALREKTSLALAVERGTVRREDITAIGDHLRGAARPSRGRTVVYAPFGLGSLDIAIGALVLERAAGREGVVTVPDFAGLL
ncbi:2,3-diaminopropionate biosynthesis protein SbnB [Streptomyces sp. WAC 00631]|uniref:2,3-diaminopropionate biosynthesis protein SbnB n=1 Tax=Streptomyces sp. WAC 00631 TaxID=2203201 RepID=UPI000F77B824|nr:2,3-diaminopropionate biosynthesis protein SbnB [Streptomyces sp. WAC 00631]MCC5033929.1 2,3-diaminopropionate biosynthesis protein SbnB [Streptomyces sp. WAC 00631]